MEGREAEAGGRGNEGYTWREMREEERVMGKIWWMGGGVGGVRGLECGREEEGGREGAWEAERKDRQSPTHVSSYD